MSYKIFDIGGSYLKIYCSKTKEIKRINNIEDSIIKLSFLKNIIKNNIEEDTEFIGLSSQMHGFILFDEFDNNLTDFYTWKNTSSLNILEEDLFDDFYLTGLKKRNDLPINNINQLFNTNNINNKKIKVKNITEGILDESYNITHITMACGNGFYNIFNNTYIDRYINYFKKKYNIELCFDNVISNKEISGIINVNNKKIPVYIGLGDFQATIYGINLEDDTLLVNFATGSQIAIFENNVNNIYNNDIFSFRPYLNNKILKCITHIPSGRFLNIYENFFKEFNINMWEYFEKLTLDDLYNSSLNISTNIFDEQGISISNIKNNINLKNFISSILHCYIKQYILLIKDNNIIFKNILLSGGIAKKIRLIKEVFNKEFENIEIKILEADDDSILGVNKFITE